MKSFCNRIWSVKQRYGIMGTFINILQKLFSLIGISINRKHCLNFVIAETFAENKDMLNGFTEFKELSYNDFVSYGEKTWFNANKLAFLKSLLSQSGNSAYGIISNDTIVCSGLISTEYFNLNNIKLSFSDGYLWDAYTHPQYRGLGFHKKLINYRIYQLYLHKKTNVLAFVDSYNRASYKGFISCGFRKAQTYYVYKIGKGKSKTTFQYKYND